MAGCTDGVINGRETDVDCGGGTCPACADGQMCAAASDCVGGECTGGICEGLLTLPACPDMAVDATMLWSSVVSKQCGNGCHLMNADQGGLNMKSAAAMVTNTVDKPAQTAQLDLVEPGVLDKSYLIFKILDQQNLAPGGSGVGMPVGSKLTDAEKCMFLNWVKGGAK
jgi:hypothetical protein